MAARTGRVGRTGTCQPDALFGCDYCAHVPEGQMTHMADFVFGPTSAPLLAVPVAETVSVNWIRPAVSPKALAAVLGV
jgi:hypothetical protein